MPRYHFNFIDDTAYMADEIGVELDSAETAFLEAFRGAQDIWHERLRQRRDPRACSFQVTDAKGAMLFVLPFAEVLESCRSRTVPPRASSVVDARATAGRMKRLTGELSEVMKATEHQILRARAILARANRQPVAD